MLTRKEAIELIKSNAGEAYKLYKRRTFLAYVLNISSIIVVPIACAFTKKDDQRLPKWASWYDEYTYGCNGEMYDDNGKLICRDGGHCGPNGRFPAPKNKTWYARVRWLLRNRLNTFDCKVNGIRYADVDLSSIKLYGDMDVTGYDGLKGNKYGLILFKKKNDDMTYFGFFGNTIWGKYFYRREYKGWKIFDLSDIGSLENIADREKAMERYLADKESKIFAQFVQCDAKFRMIGKITVLGLIKKIFKGGE